MNMENHEQQWLWKINECFIGFTADPDSNIQCLTNCCGELMGADCALYNRLRDGMLHSAALWKAPPGFNPLDRPDGHICHDVIKNGGRQVFVVRDLHRTVYAESDPNVSAYGLETYIGVPVSCKDRCAGSLCVVYQKDYLPSEEEKKMMQILAAVLGVEEERRLEAEALREAKEELEMHVAERTAELERANERLHIDIAERQQMEESLRKSQMILNKVFESIPDLLAVVDRDLRVVRSNWRGVYESAPEEIRARSPFCYQVIHPGKGKPCEPCYALEVFRTGKPAVLEKINPENDTVEIRAYPVFDDSGEVTLVTEHVRNITERKQAEMEILRINEELKEKTSQLMDAQEELVRREKMTVLGRLAGSVGHELRNPLGVMNNAVYYLKTVMPEADEKIKEYLEIINCEISHSARIIADLLEFAAIKVPQPQSAAAAEVIRRSLVKCQIPESIELRFEVTDNLPPLKVDPLQSVQVFRNLITNAVQAMPEGGTLTISAISVQGSKFKVRGAGETCTEHGRFKGDPDRDFIEISVADSGEGILAENMKEIFQPLFTTRPRGIGLGLPIARKLTEENGGLITVSTRPGKGTTFTVALPVAG
jgi:signal transduction histidine kinase